MVVWYINYGKIRTPNFSLPKIRGQRMINLFYCRKSREITSKNSYRVEYNFSKLNVLYVYVNEKIPLCWPDLVT